MSNHQHNDDGGHSLMMLIGCVLPIILVFFLPVIGVNGNVAVFIAIVLMFACHLGIFHKFGRHHSHAAGHGDSETAAAAQPEADKHGR